MGGGIFVSITKKNSRMPLPSTSPQQKFPGSAHTTVLKKILCTPGSQQLKKSISAMASEEAQPPLYPRIIALSTATALKKALRSYQERSTDECTLRHQGDSGCQNLVYL